MQTKKTLRVGIVVGEHSGDLLGSELIKSLKNDNDIEGNCYQSFTLKNGDEIDIITTNKSVYGYLAISGEFNLEYQWSSCSINTKANIGSNNGKRIEDTQKIYISKINKNLNDKKLNYINKKIEKIRVIKGTNFNYFSDEGKNIFFDKEFVVSKLSDRMGMRLDGPKIENIVDNKVIFQHSGLLEQTFLMSSNTQELTQVYITGLLFCLLLLGYIIARQRNRNK